MKLSKLHEEFIAVSKRPMQFGRLPVDPKRVELPVVPMERWMIEGDPRRLTKVYRFRRPEDRNVMVRTLLDYESEVGHHAKMLLDEGELRLSLITKGTERITELDKEYAQFADEVFKDVTSSPEIAHLPKI